MLMIIHSYVAFLINSFLKVQLVVHSSSVKRSKGGKKHFLLFYEEFSFPDFLNYFLLYLFVAFIKTEVLLISPTQYLVSGFPG